MEKTASGFGSLTIKTIVVPTVTYFLMGSIVSSSFDYASRLARPLCSQGKQLSRKKRAERLNK